MGISIVRFQQSGQHSQWGIVEQDEIAAFADVNRGDMLLTGTPGGVILNANLKVGMAILLNFTNDEKRRAKLVKSQQSVRYLQPGDKLTLSLKTKDGMRDFGTQNNEIRDAT